MEHRRGLGRVIWLEIAWIALVMLSGCVAAPMRGDATTGSLRVDQDSAWSNLVRLPGPPAPEGYGQDGKRPWFVWVRSGDQVVARSARGNPTQVDPLPFEAPIELAVRRGTRRSVVPQPNGWLVAMNGGEFGGGLYWVEAGTLRLRRLDSNLADPIRWVGARGNRIIGVSGLCHGEACGHTTTVYELWSFDDHEWLLRARAAFDGCPSAITAADRGTILVAAACGGLRKIDERGVHSVVAWPPHLYPVNVIADGESPSGPYTYYVSFGLVLAVFRGGEAVWFAPHVAATE